VDEVVEAAPYTTQLDYLEKYNVDFVVHGDDLVVNADGEDCYAAVRAAGKFKTVPRTEGVSTTDLVGRMLLITKEHHQGEIQKVGNFAILCCVPFFIASHTLLLLLSNVLVFLILYSLYSLFLSSFFSLLFLRAARGGHHGLGLALYAGDALCALVPQDCAVQ
jgi:hypothetical protein